MGRFSTILRTEGRLVGRAATGFLCLLAVMLLASSGCRSTGDRLAWSIFPANPKQLDIEIVEEEADGSESEEEIQVVEAERPEPTADPGVASVRVPYRQVERPSAQQLVRKSLSGSAQRSGSDPFSLELRSLRQERSNSPAQIDFADHMLEAKNLAFDGEFDEAKRCYEELIEAYPERYEPYHHLAIIADCRGRYSQAIAWYQQAARLRPKSPEVFHDMGKCLMEQERYAEAEHALAQAVRLNPDDPGHRETLALVCAQQERYSEALEQLVHIMSESDAYFAIAEILGKQQNVDGMKECLVLALESNPTHQPSLTKLQEIARRELGIEQTQIAMRPDPVVSREQIPEPISRAVEMIEDSTLASAGDSELEPLEPMLSDPIVTEQPLIDPESSDALARLSRDTLIQPEPEAAPQEAPSPGPIDEGSPRPMPETLVSPFDVQAPERIPADTALLEPEELLR